MRKLVINSHAKLNLYLKVLNKRSDNYHNIETLFERISLCDGISISLRRGGRIRLICSDPDVPLDSSNLCYRSASLIKRSFGIKDGFDIEIIKRIPVGAGLGGGSSNAAATLIGLNRLLGLGLGRKKLLEFAAAIGSDAPFFIYRTAFALACGRGEKVTPVAPGGISKIWHILVVPRFKVPTPLIYAKWDRSSRNKTLCKPCAWRKKYEMAGLTMPGFDVKILPSGTGMDTSRIGKGILFNSLEDVAAKAYPEIKRIRDRLVSLGVNSVLMSGSGPAVFGIVSSRKEALTLRDRIIGSEKTWRIYATRTF